MQYELRVAGHGVTDVGKVRSKNEDSLLILDEQLVYCVADGMGGVSGGEKASQKVVQCIKEQIGPLNASVSLNDKMLSIHQAVVEANQWILEWSEKNEVQGAGTTLVLLALSNEYPWAVNILHAGDSRAYRYRGGELQQITSDHSIEEAVGDNSGQPLPSQFKGLITNAVGLKKSLSLELTHADQMAGDIWLLCSDGLDKMLSNEAISAVLASDGDADVLAECLVDEANAAGGKDNVSVVIVKVLACSKQPKGALSVPFPGPLPCMPVEDEPASETSMTDTMSMETATNGSVMMSLETPDSETDFLSHGDGVGSKSAIRWIVIALAGVIIVFVLWKLFARKEVPAAVNVPVRASSSVASPEVDIEPAVTIVPLEEVVTLAEKSGDWKAAYFVVQQANYAKTAQGVKTVDAWYRQAWAEANRDPSRAMKALPEFKAAANKILSAINQDILPATSDPWPKGAAKIANEYCLRQYVIQQRLVTKLSVFVEFNSSRINFMETIPGEQIETAFKAAGSDLRSYRNFNGLKDSAKSAVQDLEKMLKDWHFLPVAKAQLESLPDSYIKYCRKADDAVNQLVVVLGEKPVLVENGNVDRKSEQHKELLLIQNEWSSIQDSLKNLNSGKQLSAGDEAAIRQYLASLFRFEKTVGQSLNHLNR